MSHAIGHSLTLSVSLPFAALAIRGQLPVGQEVRPLHQVGQLPPDFPREAHAPGVQAHVAAPLGRKIVALPALCFTEQSLPQVCSRQVTPLLIWLLCAS